jgi:quinol monooxygenase YgiN
VVLVILLTVYVKVAPENRQNAINTFKSMIGPTSVVPGCQYCYLFSDVDNDDRLLLIERWESQERFEHHIRSPDFRNIFSVMELSCEPPELFINTVSRTHGIDFIEKLLL